MRLELSDQVVDQLRETLEQVISDMSSEIAGTDHPRFRAELAERRERLREVLAQLSRHEPVAPA